MGINRRQYTKEKKEEIVQTLLSGQTALQLGRENNIYPNLIKDRTVPGINQIWCSDITYISTLSSFVYLAAIINIYSAGSFGYAIGKILSSELNLAALKMTIAARNTEKLIYHSY